MGDKSDIEWTDATWNPTYGCTKVSPACAHCYIERTPPYRMKGLRFERGHIPISLMPERLDQPLRWSRPRRIFVDSLSDLFHEDVPDEFILQAYRVMRDAYWHTFQVLTKRPERRRILLSGEAFQTGLRQFSEGLIWPLPNVWEGVTVENQRWADERIPILLDTPAAVRFVSAEPLLGPISFTHQDVDRPDLGRLGMYWINALTGRNTDMGRPCPDVPHLDWIIVGGESGPKHRPFNPDWARSIVAQCRHAGVACFVKQLGGVRPGNSLEELPPDLRVREYPR